MTSVRLYFLVVLITLSLLFLSGVVDARSHTRQGRQRRRKPHGRRLQEDESLNDSLQVTSRAKGGGGGTLAPIVPPELPTLPPLPFSTKSPSRSSTTAPTVPKNQGPKPSPSPASETTDSPVVSSPTPVPSAQQVSAGTSPTPAPSSSMVSPTEVAQEQSRTRALLPFSLNITDPQAGVDDVRLAIQDYLYQHLTESLSSLESILLTVVSSTDPAQRKLVSIRPPQQQDHRRQQQEETTTAAAAKTFDFTGEATFYPADTLPTEVEVQRAQLKALEDFHRLNDFVKTVGGYSWQIEVIQLDGMVINKDGIVVGDSGTIVNEGDTTVQANYQASSGNDNNNQSLAISLSVIIVALVLVGIVVGLLVYRRRHPNTENEPKETYQELIRSVDDLPKDLEPAPANDDKTVNISFDSATVAHTSFDSIPMTDYAPSPGSGSGMDWNRVFALSQTPVEKTMGEVFEAKTLSPPKATKIHEIVTLAPVAESGKDFESGQGEDVVGDGEDSYGYDAFPEEGNPENLVASSPVPPPREVTGGDADDDFVPSGDHYNQDRDLTIDLSDFKIDPENDPK